MLQKKVAKLRGKLMLAMLCMILAFAPSKAQAQVDPIYSADSMLRELFIGLCRDTTVSPNFLYDMAVHSLDSAYFTEFNPDTIERDIWYTIYDELRHCAYDTTVMLTQDSVFNAASSFHSDSVVMNILAYNTYRIDDTLFTPDYFDVDTINNTITELHPCEVYPFYVQKVFAASPTDYNILYPSFNYLIHPNFIFHDRFNDFATNHWTLKIDFGDGAGWQTYSYASLSTAFTYHVNYSTAGPKYITAEVRDNAGNLVMSSISTVNIIHEHIPPEPDTHLVSDGIFANVYGPCAESGELLKKNIIFLEGIDLLDMHTHYNRTAATIYEDQIQATELYKLRNFGYTFIVVDWLNSRRDIKHNAANLEKLLDSLKCTMIVADTPTHPQFVIIGESMGGLVARYALCEMEQKQSLGTLGGCLPEKMHNTRLLITFDSPNAGANLPLAYQHVYRDVGTFLFGASTISQRIAGMTANAFLDAKAAKQMLLYHVDTKVGTSYSEHPDRTAFLTDLSNVGNYPTYCKLVAVANGSIEGKGQTHWYDTVERTANDYFLDYGSDVYMRAFANNFQILGTNFELRTTPNNTTGVLAKINRDFYTPRLKIKPEIKYRWPWPPKIRWKVSIVSSYSYSLGVTHRGNVHPYDVIPGSVTNMNDIGIKTDINGSAPSGVTSLLFFGNHTPTYDNTTHTWSLTESKYVGNFGGSISSSMHTDGMHYCFIPTFSALDYSLPSTNYYYDIAADNASNNMGRTSFDVIMGNIERSTSNVYYFNDQHVTTRYSDHLGSWYNGTRRDTGHTFYDTCADIRYHQEVPILNREIGDDTLLVENRITDWECLYDAEKFIGVDRRSLYYAYPTSTGSPLIMKGIFSREDQYQIYSGVTHFRATGSNVTIYSPGLTTGTYDIGNIDWVKCCFVANQKPSHIFKEEKADEKQFAVIPNPVVDNEIIFAFDARKDADSRVLIYDAVGRKLIDQKFSISQDIKGYKYHLNFNGKLPTGTYFVIVKNGTLVYKSKFIAE